MKGTRTIFFSSILILLTFSVCKQNSEPATAQPGETYLSFTDDGAWCWFSDPRAIYFNGKYRRTYAAWIDHAGNVTVGFYDHDRKTIETTIVHKELEVDDHDNPGMFIDKDGKLWLTYSKHSGDRIYLVKAKYPEDISTWDPTRSLQLNDTVAYSGSSNTYTYTNLCQLADEQNTLYLFWRGADYKPNFSTSTDNGETWSKGKIFILPERLYRDRRPYVKIASNSKDAIHIAFTDGHPNREPTNSIYYAKYRDGYLYKANGQKIKAWSALPAEPRETDVVYDATTTNEKAWIWDVSEDQQGDPVIVYSRFPDDSTHLYYYALWEQGQWVNHKLLNSGRWFPQTPADSIETEPNYSGGIILDHQDPSTLYLSRMKNGKFEIEKWTTSDKGKNWNVTEITKDSMYDNVRPFVIRNHATGASPSVLWLSVKKYIHYTDYETAVKMDVHH
ncbi:MAG TPA: BNR-4 repeat-containing protein [Chryseolinea sp.]